MFNLYLSEGGFNEQVAGWSASAIALGMGFVGLPAGVLADRIGRKWTLLLGALVLGVSLFFRCLTYEMIPVMALSFTTGAAQALLNTTSQPFLTENSRPSIRTQLFSAHFVAMLFAGIVGNYGGGQLPELLQSWNPEWRDSLLYPYRWTLVVGALATLAALFPLLGIRERERAPEQREDAVPWSQVASPVTKLAINYVLIGIGAGLVMPFFNLYFANRFGCSSGQIGFFFALAQIITVFAALMGPRLSRRYGLLTTIVWLQLASLPFLVTLGFESTLWIAVVAFLARASLMQTTSPLQNALSMEVVPPSYRARTAGINSSMWFLGWAVSSNVSGWIMANVGYEYPYYLTAFFYGLAAVSLWWFFRKTPRGGLPAAGTGS